MRRKRSEREKYLNREEFVALLTSCGRNKRDLLLLCLAGNLGLRAGEAVRLRVEDFKFHQKSVMVPCLKWREKDPKTHKIIKEGRIKRNKLPKFYESLPISDDLADMVKSWIGVKVSGWIFNGRGGHLTERQAEIIFVTHRDKASLDSAYSFHALRHCRGTSVYRATRDVKSVQTLLRHRDMRSSQVYTHMDDELKREVSDKVGTVIPPSSSSSNRGKTK